MANPEHLAILEKGVEVWNRWRRDNPDVVPDLSGMIKTGQISEQIDLRRVNLSGSELSGSKFYDVNMEEANLRDANLSYATLVRTEFINSNLENATLTGADLFLVNFENANASLARFQRVSLDSVFFEETNLQYADLSNATIYYPDFVGADLTNADLRDSAFLYTNFSGANLRRTVMGNSVFSDSDMSEAKCLDSVKHDGPSSIGIDTIIRSKGQIPEEFLRGCGVPDEFIEFSRSLFTQPIQYYSCFISHSSLDRDFCARLCNDLRGAHVRTWYFPEDAKWGQTVWGEIDRGINIYDKLVVVCSRNSLTSGPVLREIERALMREDKEGKNILFPIRIDDYVFEEWEHPRKADLLAKVVGDFTGWAGDAAKYKQSFKRLLDYLNTDE